jgi:hypothetical protein
MASGMASLNTLEPYNPSHNAKSTYKPLFLNTLANTDYASHKDLHCNNTCKAMLK